MTGKRKSFKDAFDKTLENMALEDASTAKLIHAKNVEASEMLLRRLEHYHGTQSWRKDKK